MNQEQGRKVEGKLKRIWSNVLDEEKGKTEDLLKRLWKKKKSRLKKRKNEEQNDG